MTVFLIIAAAVIVFGGKAGIWSSGESELIGINIEAEMTAMELSWKHLDDVHYYEISRADITGIQAGEEDVARDEYTKIATVDGNKHTYRDKEVEMGHRYAYVLDGYRKSFGRLKKVCTSYEVGGTEYNTVGLATPELLNNGYGENYSNGKDKIYLYVQSYEGIEPQDATLYRKSDGDFEEVPFKLLDDRFGSGCSILDDTVEPGVTYTYKVRTKVKYRGEHITSADSEVITIPAVNFTAVYKVRAVTDPWDAGGDGAEHNAGDTFVIEVDSDACNGDTLFRSKPAMAYYVKKDEKQKDVFAFDATLVSFCKNYAGADTEWEKIPAKGVRLAAGEKIYLKYRLSAKKETYEENTVTTDKLCFGGQTAERSILSSADDNCDAAIYEGSGSGITYMTLDLVSGEGSAYLEWD